MGIENLSAQTDILRYLLKKDNVWNWTEEQTKAFENLKQRITDKPCVPHYNTNYQNVITTDASSKRLGATLWKDHSNGKLKPVRFASQFLSDTQTKYANNELKLVAVV